MTKVRKYLTRLEAADLLRTPPATLLQWRTRGYGPPATKVGTKLLYDEADVLAWLADRKSTSSRDVVAG